MKTQAYLLHALSPLHAGTGQSAGVVDLPIARMKASGIPFVPGSSIKGVLRDARRQNLGEGDEWALFGPDTQRASDHAGALMVGDARLLLLPVRSFVGTFAWVTSPLLLRLAARDLRGEPAEYGIPEINAMEANVADLNQNANKRGTPAKIYLEDLDLTLAAATELSDWSNFLARWLAPMGDTAVFSKRFVVVDDETMTFLWETATQIDTRVRLNPETRTVAQGALWSEESLPPESVLVGLMSATDSWSRNKMSAQDVLQGALPTEEILQFGGKATVGRGRCRLVPVGTVGGGQ